MSKIDLRKDTPSKGILITPERIGLYIFGLGMLGLVGFVAYEHVKGIKEDAEMYKQQAGAGKTQINQGQQAGADKILTSANSLNTGTTKIYIPPASVNYKGTGRPSDVFPLRYGQAGERVYMLHEALVKLGYLTSPTGSFLEKTVSSVRSIIGKETVSESDLIAIIQKAQKAGLMGLNGLGSLDITDIIF